MRVGDIYRLNGTKFYVKIVDTYANWYIIETTNGYRYTESEQKLKNACVKASKLATIYCNQIFNNRETKAILAQDSIFEP